MHILPLLCRISRPHRNNLYFWGNYAKITWNYWKKGVFFIRKITWLLPLMAALMVLSSCGEEQKSSSVLSILEAGEEDRAAFLTDASDIFLWEELGLNDMTASEEGCRDITVGRQQWKALNASVAGKVNELYFVQNEAGEWQLDLRASFGVNSTPIDEWSEEDGILTERVTATLGEELPKQYADYADTHYAVTITDYQGEDEITAVFTRESAEGEALYTLLSDGGAHHVLLDLRKMPLGRNKTVWRVVRYRGEGWMDQSAILLRQNTDLVQAIRQGDLEKVQELFDPSSLIAGDSNGDSLLFLALHTNHTEIAEWLISQGATEANDNIYWHDMASLLDFERSDMVNLVASIREMGLDPGCTAESLSHYLAKSGSEGAMAEYLNHFAPQETLSELESRELAVRYGLDPDALEKTAAQTQNTAATTEGSEEQPAETQSVRANLVDVAMLNGNAGVAADLLNGGATASELLKDMLRSNPTFFSDDLLAVLGAHDYFGIFTEVLADYNIFRESYRAKAQETVQRFSEDYEKYLEASVEDDLFTIAGIMDSYLLEDIVDQLAAVNSVDKPQTVAIQNLWDLMFKYADTMDTAGYYYKRIARTTNLSFRRNSRYMFELRMSQGDALRDEFFKTMALYDELLDHAI